MKNYVKRSVSIICMLCIVLSTLAIQAADGGIINFLGHPHQDHEVQAGIGDSSVVGAELFLSWSELEPSEGIFDWSRIDNTISNWAARGKKIDLRISTASSSTTFSPQWLYDNYGVRRITKGYWQSFETGAGDYMLVSGTRTSDASKVVSRSWSVYGETANPVAVEVMKTGTNQALQASTTYYIQFDYKVFQTSNYWVRATSAAGGSGAMKEFIWTGYANDSGTKSITFTLDNYSDYVISWGINGPGKISIDNSNIIMKSPHFYSEVEYPNYFDSNFKTKWQSFIQAVANRYNNNPNINVLSVGGHGRWEEVMIDSDVHGLLDDQWVTYGFTQDSYLNHVKWCIDLFKANFTNKTLRICLAYGLPSYTNNDFIYWRVAQYAVSKGVQLKQNGMSERYDTWDNHPNASYIFNRYRNNPNTKLVYETGGQIYRNTPNGYTGHPLSLMNRAMIDGADYLYLYPADINTRNVKKFVHYTNEQLGKNVFTGMYCRLGDYSMINETAKAEGIDPVNYYNMWLGLRQFLTPGAYPDYTTMAGEKCAATNANNPFIAFDIDDRQQYNGMYGAVLSIDYYDSGTDTFDVTCNNQWTGTWEYVGTVTKTNTNTWKTASLYKADWCNSYRNSGEDSHNDLVINDNGNGVEYIKSVEINFVPAREWQKTLINSSEPSTSYSVLSSTLSREITTGVETSFISIPLWTGGSMANNSLIGKVYRKVGTNYILVAKKEYYMPADGDWFEIPIPNTRDTATFRIELSSPTGSVGWYKNNGGTLAYRAYKYSTDSTTGSITSNGSQVINSGKTYEQIFDAKSPFFGAWLNMNIPSGTGSVNVSIYKKAPGAAWSPVIQTSAISGISGNSYVPFYLEPQTSGSYKIQVTLNSGTVHWNTFNGSAIVEPMYLKRLEAPRAAAANAIGQDLYRWNFNTNGSLDGWRVDSGLTAVNVNSGTLTGKVFALNPQITSPDTLGIPAGKNQFFGIRMKNSTSAAFARVYWATTTQSFDASRSVLIPIVPNDTEIRDYYYPIGEEAGWTGSIKQFRVQPVTGVVNRGDIAIDSIALTEKTILAEWNFDYVTDIFDPVYNVNSTSISSGIMNVVSNTQQSKIRAKFWSANFVAEPGQKIEIRMKNSTSALQSAIQWDYYNSSAQKTFSITANDAGYKTYTIDPTTNSNWTGNINAFEVFPQYTTSGGGNVSYDYIKIYKPVSVVGTPTNYSSLNDSWNFNTSGNFEGWSLVQHLTGTVGNGALNLNVTGTDPIIERSGINKTAYANQYVRITLKNNTPATWLSVFWYGSSGSYSIERKETIPITANDSTYKTYIIPVGANAGWIGEGTISNLRIDPIDDGITSSGTINIDQISIINDASGLVDLRQPQLTIY